MRQISDPAIRQDAGLLEGKCGKYKENPELCALGIFGGSTGGADRDRTDDLRLAKPALSQLSYCPPSESASSPASKRSRMVEAMKRQKNVNPKISARI